MNIKLLGILLVALVSVKAAAKEALLDYGSGNQIFGSYLTIYDDGSVEHRERMCCPPRKDLKPEIKLTVAEVDQLKGLIASASRGLTKTYDGRPTTDGSLSGALITFAGGSRVVIYRVNRNEVEGKPDRVTSNESIAASSIKRMTYGYVAATLP